MEKPSFCDGNSVCMDDGSAIVGRLDYYVSDLVNKKGLKRFRASNSCCGFIEDISIPLAGEHQQINAACAIAAVKLIGLAGFPVDDSAIVSGISSTVWQGRFQKVSDMPIVILDGAHNPAGCVSLRKTIDSELGGRKVRLIFGVLSDKDVVGMLRELLPVAKSITLTMPKYRRAMHPDSYACKLEDFGLPIKIIPSVKEALICSLRDRSGDDPIVVTGSLFIVGEALEFFNRDYPRSG
jgi:dihydrofolate synthase/folylpolyglutamate synthase